MAELDANLSGQANADARKALRKRLRRMKNNAEITKTCREDYIEAYCNAYLLRCGLYSAVEFCVDEVMNNWFSGNCMVQSQDSAGECIEWLEDLSCDKSGWLDACSDAIACN